MVIKLPRSRESTPVAVTPPSTTLVAEAPRVRGRVPVCVPLRAAPQLCSSLGSHGPLHVAWSGGVRGVVGPAGRGARAGATEAAAGLMYRIDHL